jgi:hypothetical protein
MKTENLNTQELETLRTLLNKMAGESKPKSKIFFDPVGVMINEIIEEFDFGKVWTVMNVLGWKWHDAEEGIPNLDELRKEAEYLLKRAAELRLGSLNDEYWELGIACCTGGFQAKAYCDEDKTKITSLDLKFIVTEWDTDLEYLTNTYYEDKI